MPLIMSLIYFIFLNYSFTGIAQYNPNAEEPEVEHMIKVAQLLIADLRKGLDMHHSVFKE